MKYINYEEGVGTYFMPAENALNGIYTLFITKFLHVKIPKYPDEMWLYLPKCMTKSVGTCLIKPMPSPYANKSTISLLNRVFDYNGALPKKKTMVFEQVIPGYERIQVELNHLINPDLCEIKMHPRSNAIDSYRDRSVFDANGAPWEIICLNSDMSQNILISFFSTTCCSPKALCNQEPVLIFLFELDELKGIGEGQDSKRAFLSRLREEYSDSNKIYCPKSVNEYKEILRGLRLMS